MGPDHIQEWEQWLDFCERQAAAGEAIVTSEQGKSWQDTRDDYFKSKSAMQRPDAEWNF